MANTEQVIIKRIQIRRDTLSNWIAIDPILADGEIGYIKDSNNIKIGNGINKFSEIENLNQEESQILLQHLNNFENPHEVTKAQVGLGDVDNTSDIDKPVSVAIQSALNNKVDKITGKGLSEDDFTTAEKTKLSGIATNANNYTHPNHTGDVTSTGDGATSISDNVVDNTKLSNVPTNTFKGRVSAETGDPEDLTITQVKTVLAIDNVDNTSDADKPISDDTQDALDNKVDKVSGKQLSTEDYTSAEKTKLSGIETGAQVNTVTSVAGRTGAVSLTKSDVGLNNVDNVQQAPLTHVGATGDAHGNATTSVAGFMSSDDKTKLNGIESGAEVNTVDSVANKTGVVTLNRSDVGLDSAITNETDTFTADKVEHIVTLTQAEYDGITPADDTIYIITDAPAIPEATQAALDDLDLRKADVSLLSSNITLFPTTVASDISGYFKMVTNLDDPDYNDTAVNVTTGTITGNAQLLASLASPANLFTGNPGYINIVTIGNIRKTGGNANQFAEFYFQVFQRANNGTETLVATSDTTGSVNPLNNNYIEFSATALLNNGEFVSTDRIVIKYYANLTGNSGATYDFQFGGTAPVRTLLPVPVSVLVSNEAEAVVYDNTASQRNVFNAQTSIDKAFQEIDTHVGNTTNPHSVTKTQVGLSNVDNVQQIPLSQKGSVNGVAELDSNGKVPSNQLPSFVDDVLEYANLASFPTTGETGKIYVTINTNLAYRWSGSAYVEISPSLALGETSATAYRGDRGKIAYEHTLLTNNPHSVTATQVGLGNVTNESKATMFTNPTFTGTVSGVTKSHVGLGNVDNTSDVNKPVSTAQQTALNAKASIINTSFTGIQVLTQAEYDAIPSPVSTVIYFIKDV